MAYGPLFKMSIQDNATGKYYSAISNVLGGYTVQPLSDTIAYLKDLPSGWMDTAVTWERDMTYMGVYRSMTSSAYNFANDARAIIQSIRSAGGVQGDATLNIYIENFGDREITYPIFYASQLDFSTYKDNMQTEMLSIGTLDSGLIRDLHAYGNTVFNIPIWAPDGLGGWVPYNDNVWALHNGLKLLYNATYISGATPTNPWVPGLITGFNHGQHATSGVDQGKHSIPNLSVYSITQNNGTTTYIGNDIMANLLLQGNQNPGSGSVINESNFGGLNDSQPFTRSNYSLKNACPLPPNSFQMQVAVSGTFNIPTINYDDDGLPCFLGFVLFEIGVTLPGDPLRAGFDIPNTTTGDSSGRYLYQMIYQVDLPAGGNPYTLPSVDFSNYDTPVTVTINPNKAYVFGIIFDETGGGGISGDGAHFVSTGFSALQFSIFSNSDGGASGIPIPAPQLNPSVFAGYRLHQMLEMLVPLLASTNANGYGFPIPVATDYTGTSAYLSNPALPPVGDGVPYQTIISSAYCLHNLEGQSYISLSLNQLFDFCFKKWGCGMGVVGDALTMENLGYYFPDSTNPANMILDLGYDVSELTIEQDASKIGANLKLGDTQADLNSDFGVDVFNTELYFNTPASNVPETIDFEQDGITTEQTTLEKIIAQQINQPIGVGYSPANPSSDNQPCAFYLMGDRAPFVLPDPPIYYCQPVDPDNTLLTVQPWQVLQYNGVMLPAAQSTDPTAATQPYIRGLNYPDAAVNIHLSPCRSLQRDLGRYLHSILDCMDSESLTFRNTYIMQFNNTTLPQAGIASNLKVGAGASPITEMQDIAISTLPPKLFLPIKISVMTSSAQNLYQILNTNPNGYIRFVWKNKSGFGQKEYKMYLLKATQQPTPQGNVATLIEGWATPDMVI